MSKARILIAEISSTFGIFQAALAPYDMVMATRLPEVERLLKDKKFDLFVIGVHFDDFRATELIKIIRNDDTLQNIPIVAVRLLPSGHAKLIRRSMEMMTLVRSINVFLELADDVDAAAKIRAAVDQYLPDDKSLPSEQQSL